MTLNDSLNFVFVQVRLEFLRGFRKNCVKTNKGRPILSAAKTFIMDSSFWRCKVYADICGGSPIFFMKTSVKPMYYLSPHVVLVISLKY